jgi:uncharacterized membrane protein
MLSIRQIAIAYPVAAVIFLALDALWLSSMTERLYRPAIGHLMLDRFAPAPAVAFYAIYVAGIVVFAMAPALSGRGWPTALGRGALLGLFAYATYDLTNQATLRDWSWRVTLADLCWGTFATAISAALASAITARLVAGIGKH